MHDQSQAEKGHIFKSPFHFAHKNILIREVSGKRREIPGTEEIKEEDWRKDYGPGHVKWRGDCQNWQRRGQEKQNKTKKPRTEKIKWDESIYMAYSLRVYLSKEVRRIVGLCDSKRW